MQQELSLVMINLMNIKDIEQIQLDAFKAGMTEAANINCPIKLPDGMIDGTMEAYHWINGGCW